MIDETEYLGQLMDAQTQLVNATKTIHEIASKCHPQSANYSNMARERLRHQSRANAEAIKVDELKEQLCKSIKLLRTANERLSSNKNPYLKEDIDRFLIEMEDKS